MMTETGTDDTILNLLHEMTEYQKLSFTIQCLERLDLTQLFGKGDCMLFADSIALMQKSLDNSSEADLLDEYIAYIAPRCGELHQTVISTPHLIENKFNIKSRSFAADAIYATSELIYHHLTCKNCPLNIMHVLENIQLSKKWLKEADPQAVQQEINWQIHKAQSILTNAPQEKNQTATVFKFPKST
tara:strand:+ start:36113 stop:36673 length:561 start_codon:yes stop_codon:yes gene_type:complete